MTVIKVFLLVPVALITQSEISSVSAVSDRNRFIRNRESTIDPTGIKEEALSTDVGSEFQDIVSRELTIYDQGNFRGESNQGDNQEMEHYIDESFDYGSKKGVYYYGKKGGSAIGGITRNQKVDDGMASSIDEARNNVYGREPIFKCEGGVPSEFKMKFTGGDCDGSANHQPCSSCCIDEKEIGDGARIVVSDECFKEIHFDEEVKKGDPFNINADKCFKETIAVKVMTKDFYGDWVVAQIVKFLPSCEKPIYVGDIFGAVEIADWIITDDHCVSDQASKRSKKGGCYYGKKGGYGSTPVDCTPSCRRKIDSYQNGKNLDVPSLISPPDNNYAANSTA